MDTIRAKTLFDLPRNNLFFSQRIKTNEIRDLHVPIHGNRFIYTNTDWRNEMIDNGIYISKYWIEEDYINPNITYLVLEFSIPKFLYGSNLYKYKASDFNLLTGKIIEFLKRIGITMFSQQVYNFIPIVIAIGENIELSEFCSCDLALTAFSPFNYRPRSKYRGVDFEDRNGREIHFGNKNSSLKVYDKFAEIFANAITSQEKQLAEEWEKSRNKRYGAKEVPLLEVLRFEYTLKNKVAIKQRLRPYFNSYPTFSDIFSKMEIWDAILREEIKNSFNHPLKNFLFLATANKPTIDAFLDMHCKCIKKKGAVREILLSLQEKGLAKTKQDFLQTYCRKTWYNYLSLLRGLEKQMDFSSLKSMSLIDVHGYIMKKLGIDTTHQPKFGF